jgi:hypothetical protein
MEVVDLFLGDSPNPRASFGNSAGEIKALFEPVMRVRFAVEGIDLKVS